MTRQIFFFLFLIIAPCALHAQCGTSFGQAQRLNESWLFLLDDPSDASQPSFDDRNWQRIVLPHDWGVRQPMSPDRGSCQGYLPGGVAWYRRHLTAEETRLAEGQHLFIYFEGVYNRSQVYVNGQQLGYRPSGFASFLYELTPYLRQGEDNVIAVRVDHSRQDDSRWYTGSGINRNVWLVRSGDVHLALWGTAWRLTQLSGTKARVEVDVETVDERTGREQGGNLQAMVEILDRDGVVVATARTSMTAPQKKTLTLNLKQAHRWSLHDPYLYKVVTRLMDADREVDRSEVPLGLRTLRFDPNHGFALNGEWMKVKGVCVHDDAGVLGTAVPADVWRNRLTTLKSLGVNAIRMSHNPHAPIVYDLCDSLGLLVMDEASDEWEFPKRKWLKGWNQGKPGFEGTYDYFEEWIDRDVADMVRRDRCHPSVFLWSIGNEVDYPNDPYSHPVLNGDRSMTQPIYGGYKPEQPNAERIGIIAQRLSAVVRSIDGSRAVTGALAGVVMSNETAYPEAVDVVGYNYTESRYEEDHQTYPHRVIYGSENRHDLAAWLAVVEHEHIFGQFLWTGIDYLGESGPWPARGSEAGLIDLAGNVKPQGWYRASLWSEQPVCHIGTYPAGRQGNRGGRGRNNRTWISPNASASWNYEQGQRVRVVCCTNQPTARLLLNGREVGGEPQRDEATRILYWDIDYEPGTLRCEAGTAVHEIYTSTRPYALRATTDKTCLEGVDDVAQIRVEVVDEQGHVVLLSDNEVSCRTVGPLRLLGMENGNIRDTRDKNQPRCRVKNGVLVAYVSRAALRQPERRERPFEGAPQVDNTPRVVFSSPWLESAEVVLQLP